jgi:cytochrome P450
MLDSVTLDDFNPLAAVVSPDPYPAYRVLRDVAPAHYSARLDCWMLSRFADVQNASRDWRSFSSAAGVDLDGSGKQLNGPGSFLDGDPPRHDLLRNVLRRWFTPSAIAALEPLVRGHVDELLSSWETGATPDLAVEFAWRLPFRTLSDLVGLPRADEAQLLTWFFALTARPYGEDTIPPEAWEARDAFRAYLRELAAARAAKPREDILSTLAEARIDGEPLGDELLGICFLLFVAGIETTASLLSNSLFHLASDEQQRELVAADAECVPAAVEELLRFDAPIQNLARVTTSSMTLHDVQIPEGARVLLLHGAANRDERRYEDPDRLDVTREPKRHVAFGDGIHHCLGAPLARLEARIALQRFFELVGDYRVVGDVQRQESPTARGLTSLPVAIERR